MVRSPAQLAAARQELEWLQQMLGLVPNAGSKHAPHDAVFVCVDCEAWERQQNRITEIGIAVLDTRDIAGLTSNDGEEAWFAKMKYAHFRPVEYAKLKNRTFIKGCPEQFNFGDSTWVNLVDLRIVLKRIFQCPSEMQHAGLFDVPLNTAGRNVVFVGHGASNDTAYMQRVGFTLGVDADVVRTVDTQIAAGGSKKRSVGLQRLLLSLGLEPVNLHNAGNDAAYTLQALVLMALKDFKEAGAVFTALDRAAGKLPPARYSITIAKHVWAGTTMRPVAPNMDRGPAVKSAPAEMGRLSRKDHKRCARAARKVKEDTAAKAAGLTQCQRPLPAQVTPSRHADNRD